MAQRDLPEPVLKYIKHLRENYSGIKNVYIFGSFVKGTADSNSDIDIAVVFDKILDSFDLQVQLMKIRRQYDSRIEPHVFRADEFGDSHPFANEIIESGQAIE